MAEVDAQAYSVTTANAANTTSNSIETQQPGATGALRQTMTIGDPNTRANIAGVTAGGGLQIAGTQTTATTVAWTSATTVNTTSAISIAGMNTVTVALTTTSTMTGGVLSFEISPDNTNWFPIAMARIDSFTVETSYTLNTVTNRAWSTSADGFTNFRVRLSTVIAGTGTATVIIKPETFAIEPISTVGQATASNLNATVSIAGAQTLSTVSTVNAVTGITNALPSGTNTIGGVFPATRTSGGATMFTLISAATTNATLVKASGGTLYSLTAFNNGAAVAYVKLFNMTTAPTVGTSVAVKTLMLPAGGGLTMAWPTGEAFGTGISYCVTGAPATADTTAVALNQVIVNGSYA